jgi:hypothetical protein
MVKDHMVEFAPDQLVQENLIEGPGLPAKGPDAYGAESKVYTES